MTSSDRGIWYDARVSPLALFSAGLVIGALVASVFWLVRSRAADSATALAGENARRVVELERQLGVERQQVSGALSRLETLTGERAALGAQLESERASSAEKLAVVADAQRQLKDTFEALSGEALRRSQESFLQLAQERLGQYQQASSSDLEARQQAITELLKPVRESLERVDTQLVRVDRERVGSYESVAQQLKGLSDTHDRLRRETDSLVRALRSPNVRGRWGEVQLRRVVELAGMIDYCDFTEKESATTDEGARLTPDLIIRLPGGTTIVVDSKVPIDAYLQSVDAPDEPAREAKLRDHARQVREHVKALGKKRYWEQFRPTPEFVVMFMPGEALLSGALQYDTELIEIAATQRVIPASPLTLIAVLRAVAYGWQQNRLVENAEQLSQLGKEMYDRLCTMADNLAGLGTNLRQAVESYNRTIGTIESRVLVTARRFRDMGVSTPDELEEVKTVQVAVRDARAPELTGLFDDEAVDGEIIRS